MPYLLPTEEETSISLTFKDGQPPLVIDAIDVDDIVVEVHSKKPEDASFLEFFSEVFEKRFKRKISKTAANMLCQIKRDIFDKVKKNLYVQDEPSECSQQDNTAQNES